MPVPVHGDFSATRREEIAKIFEYCGSVHRSIIVVHAVFTHDARSTMYKYRKKTSCVRFPNVARVARKIVKRIKKTTRYATTRPVARCVRVLCVCARVCMCVCLRTRVSVCD